MPKRRLGWLMKKGMFVVPAEDSWDKRKGKHPRKTKRPRGQHLFNDVALRAQIRRLRDLGIINEFDYEEALGELRDEGVINEFDYEEALGELRMQERARVKLNQF